LYYYSQSLEFKSIEQGIRSLSCFLSDIDLNFEFHPTLDFLLIGWIIIHNAIQANFEKGTLQVDIERLTDLTRTLDIDKRNPEYNVDYVAVSIQDSGSLLICAQRSFRLSLPPNPLERVRDWVFLS
jgi:hypothetical protein